MRPHYYDRQMDIVTSTTGPGGGRHMVVSRRATYSAALRQTDVEGSALFIVAETEANSVAEYHERCHRVFTASSWSLIFRALATNIHQTCVLRGSPEWDNSGLPADPLLRVAQCQLAGRQAIAMDQSYLPSFSSTTLPEWGDFAGTVLDTPCQDLLSDELYRYAATAPFSWVGPAHHTEIVEALWEGALGLHLLRRSPRPHMIEDMRSAGSHLYPGIAVISSEDEAGVGDWPGNLFVRD